MKTILSNMCLEPYVNDVERVKIETLVTIQVHNDEITKDLKCKDINDFDW